MSEINLATLSNEAFAKHQAEVIAEAARRTAQAQEWLRVSKPAAHAIETAAKPANGNGNGHHKKAAKIKPTVKVLFRDPRDPSHTWSGRGRQPRWMGTRNKEQFRVHAS